MSHEKRGETSWSKHETKDQYVARRRKEEETKDISELQIFRIKRKGME